MISVKTLKQFGVKDIGSYFDKMVAEYMDGNYPVVIAMFSNTSIKEKQEFLKSIIRKEDVNIMDYFIELL